MSKEKSIPVSIRLDHIINKKVRETIDAKIMIDRDKISLNALINNLLRDWCNLEENVAIREKFKINSINEEERKEIELMEKLMKKYLNQ